MKHLNRKLSSLTLLALILILSSCSQQRYASRSYVKSAPKETAEVKKASETASLPSAMAEIPAPVPQALEITPLEAKAVPSATPKTSEAASAPKFLDLKNKTANRAVNKALKQLKKSHVIEKEDTTHDINLNNSWIRIFIIGLIILLIGILIPGPVGSVFYIVGSILMVVALIFFLLELL